jgi:hypothetical protein
MDPLTLSILAASALGSVGSTIAAGQRQKAANIQSAIAEEGKSTQSAIGDEAEKKRAALANLIANYRSSFGG